MLSTYIIVYCTYIKNMFLRYGKENLSGHVLYEYLVHIYNIKF